MSYGNTFTREAKLFRASEWISTDHLTEILSHMDGIKFAIESNRQAALEFWAGYRKTPPFAHDVQFPEWDCYVRLSEGDWPQKVQQLLTALQYKEEKRVQQTASTSQGGSGRDRDRSPVQSEEPEIKDRIPNDVLLSFTTAVRSMRYQIGKQEGVYDRDKLHTNLRLAWT
jgi:hypothetical protein